MKILKEKKDYFGAMSSIFHHKIGCKDRNKSSAFEVVEELILYFKER